MPSYVLIRAICIAGQRIEAGQIVAMSAQQGQELIASNKGRALTDADRAAMALPPAAASAALPAAPAVPALPDPTPGADLTRRRRRAIRDLPLDE